MSPISSLTSEQQSRIPLYTDKWRSLVVSTEPMNRQRARGALQAAYLLAGKAEPEFVFVNGPQELQEFREQESSVDLILRWGTPINFFGTQFYQEVESQFTPELWKQIQTQLVTTELNQLLYQLYYLSTYPLSGMFAQAMGQAWQQGKAKRHSQLRDLPLGELLVQLEDGIQENLASTWQEFNHNIWQPLREQTFMEPVVQELNKWNYVVQQIGLAFSQSLSQGHYHTTIYSCIGFDFCSSILDFSDAAMRTWTTLRSVIRSCGIVVPWENLCIVVERPTKILLDAEKNLHGDEEPAITFADGSQFYADHGDIKHDFLTAVYRPQ